jgi:hypothetical protein
MTFYFYEEAMRPVCKIAVDGLVPNSFHLSHWKGNQTPNALKADTATGIALNYMADPHHPSLFPNANIITNSRFNTDGLFAAFTLLDPKAAQPMAHTLIAAAEAGGFCAFSSEEGVQIDLLIKGLISDQSPLRSLWKKTPGPPEAAWYKTILPLLPDLYKIKDQYQSLWQAPFDRVLASMTSFRRDAIGFEEYDEEGLSIIVEEILPARQAIDAFCKGDLFLVIEDCKRKEGRYRYELLYRYYAWADTVHRAQIPKLPMEPLAQYLNQQEAAQTGNGAAAVSGAVWTTEVPSNSPTSALIFSDREGRRALSALTPDYVAQSVLSYLRKVKGIRPPAREEPV